MQRTALGLLVFLAGATLTVPLWGQIITAQPAQTYNPSPPYSAPYSVAYPPAYSAYPPAYSPSSPAALGTSLLQSPEANTIRGWYRDYLGRDAGQDLSALVNLMRGGMSPTDMQATILGSDEFFSQKGRDPQTFVRDTLQAVNWAEPSYADLQRWTDRLNQLRGDRFALAREILQSNNQPQSRGIQLGDLATRLSSASRLAVDTINYEVGSTPQGRQANLQAQALADAAEQLRRSMTGTNGGQYTGLGADSSAALANMDRAYQALQTTLSNPPGTAPSAASLVRQIGTMLADARGANGPAATGAIASYPATGGLVSPGGPAPLSGSALPGGLAPPINLPPALGGPGNSPVGTQQLLDQIASARRAAESLIQTLTSQAYQDYTYNVVIRDLDTLASRLTALDPLVRSGASRDRLAQEVQALTDSVNRIRTQLGDNRLPYSARLYWQSLDSSVAQLRDTVGVANVASSTMLRPTVPHENLLPLVDLAASQIDVFLAGTTPLVYSIADVPSIQADARSLKGRVLVLRQQAGAGQPASVLKQTLNGMIGDYQDAFDRWNRVVASYRLVNPAQLSPIGETLNRVEQSINQALTSGDLTPAGPTRVAQDLAQLNTEVTDARRSVQSLTGYREQQSIDQYLEQLSGYVQQIGDALSRPTTVDARRLAVGMQGVMGHMQTDIDSLNRTAGVGVPTLRQQTGDLQYRADRIGRLVDDIESQLY